jgi:transcription elongation factor GreA
MATIPSVPLTKEKFISLQKEKDTLLTERVETIAQVQKAREMGDLSENGLYKASKSRLNHIDSMLYRIDELLKYGKVIETSQHEMVEVGNTVTFTTGEIARTVMIVSKFEANPAEGKISVESPIGKALLKKRIGDTVQIETPKGIVEYKVVTIA